MRFVSVKKESESAEPHFNFGCLFGQTDALDRMLLRTQMTLVHAWMEGFKTLPMAKFTGMSKKGLRDLDFANNVNILRRLRG